MPIRGGGTEPSRGGFAPREPAVAPGGPRRTYRMGKGWQVFLGVAAMGFAGGAVAVAFVDSPSTAQRVALLVPFGLFSALSAYGAIGVGRMRVTIDDAGIEYVEWKKPRRILLDRIAGYRTLQTKNQSYLVFEPRDPGAKKLKVPRMGSMDGAFGAWLARIPDLDAADRARSEAELLASRALGGSPVERQANLRRATLFARGLSVVAVAAAAWAMLYPVPYPYAVGTAFSMPVLAIGAMLVRPGVFQLLGAKNDVRPQLVAAIFLPGLAGTLRAFDFDLLAPAQLVVPALVGGIAVGLSALLADRAVRRRPAWLLLLAPWFAVQAAGALTVANCFRDPSTPTEYRAAVLDKHVSRGKTTTYELRLGPWGPRAEPGPVKVFRDQFERVEVGDGVRIRVRPGRLSMPWFRVVGRAP